MKNQFEIWADEMGIPVTGPLITLSNPQQVRDFLIDNDIVCQREPDNVIDGNGHSVHYEGKKISLDYFFSDDDFYSSREWAEILG